MGWLEKAEESLERDFEEGNIDRSEYNQSMRELHDEYRDCARESAEAAYENELSNW